MNVKIKSLLFELSRNSRITTQQLGRRVSASQQSASYLKRQLENKESIRGYTTVLDPSRLGYMNILVGFDFKTLKNTKAIIQKLEKEPSIISVTECTRGVDLLVEYCEKNLSAFNKTHSQVIHNLSEMITTKFVFPVVVRHKYARNYLAKKSDEEDNILSGDRETYNITATELFVLKSLLKSPNGALSSFTSDTTISLKSLIRIKKKLEAQEIIKGYSVILDMPTLEIPQYVFFLSLTGEGIGEINKFVEYCHSHKNIVEVVKIIGTYHLFLTAEGIEETALLQQLRSTFSIHDYIVVPIARVIKESYADAIE